MKIQIPSFPALALAFLTLFCGGGGIEGAEEEMKRTEGAVLLTFDDMFISQWLAVAPIFKQYEAHATFFVVKPDCLSPKQIAALRDLQKAGHSIACHSMRHEHAVRFVKANGVDKYLEKEILPAVKALKSAGFLPTAFAYPGSGNNAQTDAALLKIFRHLRTGTGLEKGKKIKDTEKIFVPVDKVAETGCLVGTGIDYAGTEKRPDYVEQVFRAMERAKAKKEVVVFYAHNISDDGPGHHLSPEALRKILAHAKTIGLPVIGYDELP